MQIWASFRVVNALSDNTVDGSFVSSDDSDTAFVLPPGAASNFSNGLVNTGYLNLAMTASNTTIESANFLE
jgi:hypothetical protein